MPKTPVIGYDPSLTNWGTALATLSLSGDIAIEDLLLHSTAPETSKKVRKSSDRLRRAQEIFEFINQTSRGRHVIFCEIPSGSQSAVASFSLGIATGLIAACPMPVIQVDPIQTKMASVGKRNASKIEMINWAVETYPNAPWKYQKRKGKMELLGKNEHLADAVAVIHAGIKTDQWRQVVTLMNQAGKQNRVQLI